MMERLSSDTGLCVQAFVLILLWFAAGRADRRSGKVPDGFKWGIAAATFLRVICGLVLVAACLDKLDDPYKFSKVIENYRALPLPLVPAAAIVIPWLEFFTGVCLMTGFRRRSGALLYCVLMGVYTLSIAWSLLNGIEMNCGCFTMDSTEKITWLSVIRDALLLGLGLIVLFARRTYASLENDRGTS